MTIDRESKNDIEERTAHLTDYKNFKQQAKDYSIRTDKRLDTLEKKRLPEINTRITNLEVQQIGLKYIGRFLVVIGAVIMAITGLTSRIIDSYIKKNSTENLVRITQMLEAQSKFRHSVYRAKEDK